MLKGHYKEIAESQDKLWWYLGMSAINRSLLDTHLVKKRKLKILDAGCGPGAMLPTLSTYGDVIGVDLSDDALKFAEKRGNVQKGDISNLNFKDETFDVVVCMDVLYHMWVKDELNVLKEFNRVLKKGGILLVREPAYDWLRGNQDRVGLTVRRFSKPVLKEKLQKSYFKVITITYANFFLFPLVLSVRMFKSKKQVNKKESDLKLLPPYINSFLLRLLMIEASLIKYISLPFGSSLICVAKKIK